jgi:phenylalanyl-tRNA synthetase alpha subunit
VTAREAAETAEGQTFEKVWVALQETLRCFRELSEKTNQQQEETFRCLRELSEKTDRQQEKTDRQLKKTARQIKEVSKNIGGINNSFGKWSEEMVSAKLWKKFDEMGYTFTHGGPQKYWEGDRAVCQVDMLLENGDYAMPVEIKSVLAEEDVREHLERMEQVRKQFDKHGDRRKLVGAVAGMVVAENVRSYAQKRGLYVLVPSGDSVAVAQTPENFKPREW